MWRSLLTGVALAAVLAAPVLLLRHTGSAPMPGISQDPKAKGPPAAPIRIVEFSQFACSHCRQAQPDIQRILREYAGKIHLVFRHFAYDGKALLAHAAAEAAAEQGRFWPYHDRLFEAQPVWTAAPDPKPLLIAYAEELGLDPEKFRRALEDEAVRERVRMDYRTAQGMGVSILPSFLIQDRLAPLDPSHRHPTRLVAGEIAFRRDADRILREILETP